MLIVIATSCGSHNKVRQGDEAASALSLTPDTLCFRQVVGRDSVRLKLITKGTFVTGQLTTQPYAKDRATGPLVGTRTGDAITADWQRVGEGVTQINVVDFVVTADTVRWREGERIEKGGKWVLKTPNEGFNYKLAKVNCP